MQRESRSSRQRAAVRPSWAQWRTENGRVMLSHRRYPAPYDSCKRMTGDMSHVGAIAVGIVYFLAIIDPKITLKDSMAQILNGGSRNFQS